MQSDPNLLKAWAEIISSLAWPILVLVFVPIILWFLFRWLNDDKSDKELSLGGPFPFTIKSTKGGRAPEKATDQEKKELTKELGYVKGTKEKPLPPDYYFLNHTSFLRTKDGLQEAFQKRTGVPARHFDIRVIVDSYYQGAIERIDQVEYFLHEAYPEPKQIRRNPDNNFLLKELANGEYVLMAKVYLKDRQVPIVLQRYITLWTSGPRLD